MIFDIFSELQRPGALASQDFRAVYTEAIEQAQLADELGFGCWWAVEHHGTPEFSLSSVPEMMLLAIAQKTERIRLGHAAVLAPFKINHPLRVAERAAHCRGHRAPYRARSDCAKRQLCEGTGASTPHPGR